MKAETAPARGRSALRGLVIPGLLTLLVLAVLISLGNWQMRRLAWKEALIARVEARVHAEPVALPPKGEWASLADPQAEYMRVRLSGIFLHGDEAHVYAVLSEPRGPAGGQGWWVMTPLALDDGSFVLVNRGFVPRERKGPQTRLQGQVSGRVTLTGLVRAPESGNYFTPDDNPTANIWFRRDPKAIAEAVGLPPDAVAPFFVDAEETAPGGLPQGGETRLTFPNNHLQYALTWYALAVALCVMFALFVRRRLTGR